MDLFRKKSVDQLVAESTPLKRTMRTFDLTMLGIGAIIGTGIFVLTGKGALTAGPALSVSFLLAAVCCGFAGLCYAEFAAMAPVSGSAYSYAYLAFGELIAFVIGWDLILGMLCRRPPCPPAGRDTSTSCWKASDCICRSS